jgi:hypothetical protein
MPLRNVVVRSRITSIRYWTQTDRNPPVGYLVGPERRTKCWSRATTKRYLFDLLSRSPIREIDLWGMKKPESESGQLSAGLRRRTKLNLSQTASADRLWHDHFLQSGERWRLAEHFKPAGFLEELWMEKIAVGPGDFVGSSVVRPV